MALAVIPVGGVFTRSRMFVVRDLALTFWSRFLFLRHSIASGSFPFWDPYAANGQAAVNDALNQLFHLPSLAIRLLLPELIAYNLWVALPLPLAALGMYLFLRRYVSRPASSFGAIAFAVSGPIVSSPNFPNFSWSVVSAPYVFWAIDRVFDRSSARTATVLAIVVSCQALAGEPVTLATTLVIAAAYSTIVESRWRNRRAFACVTIGVAAGLLLSAIQYVPLAYAGMHSVRGTGTTTDFWSFHPLALFELLVPHFFGDYFNSNLRELAWMLALNSDRDPYYYTMYIGVGVALVAAVAMLSGRPRTRFWTLVIAACAVASLGPHTPVYPLLQHLLPPLRSFRFPVKYLSLAAFAFATLSALSFQWLLDGDAPRAAVRRVLWAAAALAALTYLAVAWVLIAPALPIRLFFHLAIWAKVPTPIQGAEFVLYRARPLLSSLLLKVIASMFLLWVAASRRSERRLGVAAFAATAVLDLLASNMGVNPTLPTSMMAEPAWLQQIPRDLHERVYMGARLEGFVNALDVDAPKYVSYPDTYTQMEQRYLLVAEIIFNPSGFRLRDPLSYDLPLLWPIEYAQTVGRFKFAPREDRLRFLSRVGTRFAVLPSPPYPGAKPLARLRGAEQLQLYDFNPRAQRVYITPDALVGPDIKWQIEGLFQPRYDLSRGVLVSEPPPPPAGINGLPVAPAAWFIEDDLNKVVVRAGLPADGYLLLLDSYDPDWKVDVDGSAAPLMRANGIFRAVHLRPGTHVVTFQYRPHMFYIGAAVTTATALALAVWCVVDVRRRRAASGA